MGSSQTAFRPRGVSVTTDGAVTTLLLAWRSPFAFAMVPLAVLTGGIAVAVFRATLTGKPWLHPIQLIPLALAGATLVLGYLALVRLVNRSRIDVSARDLRVTHGPLPWIRPPLALDATGLREIRVSPCHVHYDATRATFHHVWARHRSGGDFRLLGAELERAQAGFIAQKIAEALRVDCKVETASG